MRAEAIGQNEGDVGASLGLKRGVVDPGLEGEAFVFVDQARRLDTEPVDARIGGEVLGQLPDHVVEGRVASRPQVAHLTPAPAAFSQQDHQPAGLGLGDGKQGVLGADAADALEEEGRMGGPPGHFSKGRHQGRHLEEEVFQGVVYLKVGEGRVHGALRVGGQSIAGGADVQSDGQVSHRVEIGFGVHDDAGGNAGGSDLLEPFSGIPPSGVKPKEEHAVPSVCGEVAGFLEGGLNHLVVGIARQRIGPRPLIRVRRRTDQQQALSALDHIDGQVAPVVLEVDFPLHGIDCHRVAADAGQVGLDEEGERDGGSPALQPDVLALAQALAGEGHPEGAFDALTAHFHFDGESVAQARHVVVKDTVQADILAERGVAEGDDVNGCAQGQPFRFGVLAPVEPAIRGQDHGANWTSCPLARQPFNRGG